MKSLYSDITSELRCCLEDVSSFATRRTALLWRRFGTKFVSKNQLRFQGWDVALNHTAVVEINFSGKVTWFAFVTDKVKIGGQINEATLYHVNALRKRFNKEDLKLHRLAHFSRWIQEAIERRPYRVAIENYAYGKKSNAYEIGEFGGVLRDTLMREGIPFRLWGPLHIKKFAGIPSSEKPIEFCLAAYNQDWRVYNCGLKADTAGDLADAHTLADMARQEHLIKIGKLKKPHAVFKRIDGVEWNTQGILDDE